MKAASLGAILQALHSSVQVFQFGQRLKQSNKKLLEPIIQPLLANNDGTIRNSDLIKIYRYYALGVPAILAHGWSALHGHKIQSNALHCSAFLGAMTGLFDDLYDDWQLPASALQDLILYPQEYVAHNSAAELCTAFYLNALANAPRPNEVKLRLMQVLNAQTESLKQSAPTLLQMIEIQSITAMKGGNSVLFYREAMTKPPHDAEVSNCLLLGELMQMGNDFFDIYKDHQAKIQTLVTAGFDINLVATYFHQQLDQFIAQSYSMPFPKAQVEKFLSIVGVVLGRVLVCLTYLIQLQAIEGGKLNLNALPRKTLIVDMEKPANLMRSIVYQSRIR